MADCQTADLLRRGVGGLEGWVSGGDQVDEAISFLPEPRLRSLVCIAHSAELRLAEHARLPHRQAGGRMVALKEGGVSGEFISRMCRRLREKGVFAPAASVNSRFLE